MRVFEKAEKLNNVKYEVRGAVPAEADKMVQAGEKVLKLNIGNPAIFGFNAPEELFEALTSNMRSAQPYSDSKGILPARQAILEYHRDKKHLPNLDVNEIYIGNGASELIMMCMQTLLNPGDEILIPSPDYPLWTAAATLSGGKIVHYMCDEQSDWNPDVEDMKKKITSRTKAIVIINPNNPTGALYSEDILQQIVAVARENELIIFADEIYDRVVYEGEHTSIASLAPDLFCVTFNGLSKSHVVCGYRSGWMVLSGDKSKAKGFIEGLTLMASMRLCSNVLSQYVIAPSLKQDEVNPWTLPGGRLYEQAKLVTKALNDIPGVSVVAPKGSMYCFPKLDERFNITNDQQFALDFLHSKKVLMGQGTGFNWPRPDHFRVVFLPNVDDLQVAMDNLKDFLAFSENK